MEVSMKSTQRRTFRTRCRKKSLGFKRAKVDDVLLFINKVPQERTLDVVRPEETSRPLSSRSL